MSMFTNLFHKKSASSSVAPASTLVNNPLISNATQMNNQFLHHKAGTQFNQQGSFLQAPVAPAWGQRGLSTYRRGGPYRQFRLRTHNWGTPSENGWSGFNNWKYQPQNLASWEPKNVILEELRAQHSQSRGLTSGFQNLGLVQAAPLFAAPIAAPAKLSRRQRKNQRRSRNGKQRSGHHHGVRNSRAQAVLPVQPIGGGPAIATLAPTPIVAPIVAAPIISAPIAAAPFATRGFAAPLAAAPLVASPLHETIVRPTIIQETVRHDRILEVQPVLHRQIEQPVVNHIEKHISEAPAAHMGGTVRMAPIVQETRSTHVIDEVQPIVHREVAVTAVERVEEHLTEHVVAPTQHTNSIVNEAFVAPVAAAPIAPLSNTVPITKVVPNYSSAPILEKQQQAPIVEPVYGSAMM